MNKTQVLPSVAVFQAAILRQNLEMAAQARSLEDTQRHVAHALGQLDVFLELAREAVYEQNGEGEASSNPTNR